MARFCAVCLSASEDVSTTFLALLRPEVTCVGLRVGLFVSLLFSGVGNAGAEEVGSVAENDLDTEMGSGVVVSAAGCAAACISVIGSGLSSVVGCDEEATFSV